MSQPSGGTGLEAGRAWRARLYAHGGWVVAGVLAFLFVAVAASSVWAGSLDPPGPPGSTMIALNDLPPDWVQQLDSTNGNGSGCGSSRFECVMSRRPCDICLFVYDGALDKETGLVWQRNLGNYTTMSWDAAESACGNYAGGNRKGWRLPTAAELMSLLDKGVTSPNPSLPAGHPFINVPAQGAFWTATRDVAGTTFWVVRLSVFQQGQPGDAIAAALGTTNGAWCVRGAE